MPDNNGLPTDTSSWQSGGPFIFTNVQMSIEGNVCTLVLTVGQYNRTVMMTKATARDLYRMLGLRFETDEDHETQKRAW